VRVEKWQALGNHFLLVERGALPHALTPERVRLLCDPATGFGADGVLELVLEPGDGVDAAVTVHNRDGGIAEVSGNGTRIAAAYAAGRLGRDALRLRTGAGEVEARRGPDGRFGVTMGRAALDGAQYRPNGQDPGVAHRFVSIGNPHCVVAVEDVDAFPLSEEGPRLEHHAWFPERANVEAVRVLDRHRLRLRVWERGVGETQACGSGACAAAVAAVLDGLCASPVSVEMPGGAAEVRVADDLALELAGPAERVYAAELDPALLARLHAA
jgi:diaminopimelate epimerase